MISKIIKMTSIALDLNKISHYFLMSQFRVLYNYRIVHIGNNNQQPKLSRKKSGIILNRDLFICEARKMLLSVSCRFILFQLKSQ